MALKDWKKDEINLIIVGETGVGKTVFKSFIDNMCNGRTIDEFENTFEKSNESGGPASQSQTLHAMLYRVICAESSQPHPRRQLISILDTPGLGDTRGIEFNNRNKRDVAQKIRDELETIDAVIIVANDKRGLASRPAMRLRIYRRCSRNPS
ncbi:hypothetical protein AX17_004822 [Amanita inopinata Kibby_2008]|nr:hypothetical protein AX17_004822 [Amanita inopinata Kibby_2008]